LLLVIAPIFAENAVSNGNTSIAMLNYLATETRIITSSKDNRLILEEIYNKLINNTNPGAVDETTQDFLQTMLDDIKSFRILPIQRDRLQYMLENRQAQAITQAMPNPLYLLGMQGPGGLRTRSQTDYWDKSSEVSATANVNGPPGTSVQGKVAATTFEWHQTGMTETFTAPLKLISVAGLLALDSIFKYQSARNDAELSFLQDNWVLDDNESATLHNLRSRTFSYMIDVARKNNLGIADTLNEEGIDNFVKYSLDENLERRRQALEGNIVIYASYAPYWLKLAETYYDLELYAECLRAVRQYEAIKAPIFRRDYDLANVLPKAVIASYYVYESDSAYVTNATALLKQLVDNTTDENWTLRYFAAQAYIGLAAVREKEKNLNTAYQLLVGIITHLSQKQEKDLASYLSPINETVPKGTAKKQKKQAKETIADMKKLRKTELPPLNSSLSLGYKTIFQIMDELKTPEQERERIKAIVQKSFIIPSYRHTYFNEPYSVLASTFTLKRVSSGFFDFLNTFFSQFTGKTKWNKLKLTLPVIFLSDGSKIDFSIRDYGSYDMSNITYHVNEVNRKKTNEISYFTANIEIPFNDSFTIAKNQAYTMLITISTDDVSSNLIFLCPAGKSSFELSSIE
jgi:hypothetical protein